MPDPTGGDRAPGVPAADPPRQGELPTGFRLAAESPILIPPTIRDMGNPPWEEAGARILVVRLSPWKDVDISDPHLVLFAEVRRAMPDAFVDFAFLPPERDRKALDRLGLPWFFGRASRKSPAMFDLVMVSNSFALELVNLPYLFSSSGLPALSSARAGLARCPVVILGGSNASCTGSLADRPDGPGHPAKDALVDGIFFGEGEGAIGPLARILCGYPDGGLTSDGSMAAPPAARPEAGPGDAAPAPPEERSARLAAAASVAGFWPCLHADSARRRLSPARPSFPGALPAFNGENASTTRLALTSGCPGFCSFCLEGWDRRPYRELPLEKAIDAARELRRVSGAQTLEVYSFNFNTHADIAALVFELNRIFRRVSFMSQRLDILARAPGLAALEMAGGKRSFTLGIEGISPRMRAYYRKGLTDGDLASCVESLSVPGVKELKLFFMISGFESIPDIESFSEFMASVAAARDRRAPGMRVLVSAGYLVRLPFTPLQFAPHQYDRTVLESISARMSQACARSGIEYRLAADFDEYTADQVLAMDKGDLLPWLAGVPAEGHVYDGTLSRGTWPSLRRRATKLRAMSGGRAGEKGEEFRPPLEFVESDAHHRVLRRHYLEAAAFIDRDSCLGGSCSGCGACGEKEDISRMTGHRSAPVTLGETGRIRRLMEAKASFSRVHVRVEVPEEMALAHPEYRATWVLKTLSRLAPGAERFVFGADEVLFAPGSPFGEAIPAGAGRWGASAFTLVGPDAARIGAILAAANAAGAAGAPGVAVAPSVAVAACKPSAADGAGPFVVLPGAAPPQPRFVDLEFTLDSVGAAGAADAFSAWADESGAAHRRWASGAMDFRFEAAASARGRRVFESASVTAEGSSTSIRIRIGERAKPARLLASQAPAPALRILAWS